MVASQFTLLRWFTFFLLTLRILREEDGNPNNSEFGLEGSKVLSTIIPLMNLTQLILQMIIVYLVYYFLYPQEWSMTLHLYHFYFTISQEIVKHFGQINYNFFVCKLRKKCHAKIGNK